MALEANNSILSLSNLGKHEEPISINPSKTFEVFSKNRVLLRAIETDLLGSSPRPDLSNWDWECSSLKSNTGRVNTCCTLLIPNQTVGAYKPFGMLFNAETSKVFHAAAHDMGSCVHTDGKMHLPEAKGTPEDMTLDELAKYTINTPIGDRAYMNEVNADFQAKDLLGLFINKMTSGSVMSAVYKLQILMIQKFIKDKHAFDLPLFVYDQIKGSLEIYDAGIEQIRHLIIIAKNLLDVEALRPVANVLGFELSKKGQISLTA